MRSMRGDVFHGRFCDRTRRPVASVVGSVFRRFGCGSTSIVLAGCSGIISIGPPPATDDSGTPDQVVDAGPPDATGPEPIPWLNPSHCLAKCDHDDTPGLISIDAGGKPNETGPFLVHESLVTELGALLDAATQAGHELKVRDGYRTHQQQQQVYGGGQSRGGVARPGHSEHETGLAVDTDASGRPAPTQDWLAQHAHEFGFVVSYPRDKQKITGYIWESWHIRYVGREIASSVVGQGLALEEYFRRHPELGTFGDCSDCAAPESREPCGSLTAQGMCDGSVLRWCYDGTANAVDCALSETRCEVLASTDADCVLIP